MTTTRIKLTRAQVEIVKGQVELVLTGSTGLPKHAQDAEADEFSRGLYEVENIRYGCDWAELNGVLWGAVQWTVKDLARYEDLNEATRKALVDLVERIARA